MEQLKRYHVKLVILYNRWTLYSDMQDVSNDKSMTEDRTIGGSEYDHMYLIKFYCHSVFFS